MPKAHLCCAWCRPSLLPSQAYSTLMPPRSSVVCSFHSNSIRSPHNQCHRSFFLNSHLYACHVGKPVTRAFLSFTLRSSIVSGEMQLAPSISACLYAQAFIQEGCSSSVPLCHFLEHQHTLGRLRTVPSARLCLTRVPFEEGLASPPPACHYYKFSITPRGL